MDLKFFLKQIAAIAYLTNIFGDLTRFNLIKAMNPGTIFVRLERNYQITGIPIKDTILFPIDGSIYYDCEIGHEHDYSTLICYGMNEKDDGPRCLAWWQTEMIKLDIDNYIPDVICLN